MDALILHSSFYMNTKSIEEKVWQSYAIPKMIQCCISKRGTALKNPSKFFSFKKKIGPKILESIRSFQSSH